MLLLSAILFIAPLLHSAVTTLKGSVTTIDKHLTIIETQVADLNNALDAFSTSGASLETGLNIHNVVQILNNGITTATVDITTFGTVGLTDAVAILTHATRIQPSILTALAAVVAKKPTFDALPPFTSGSQLVKKELAKSDIPNASHANQLVKNNLVTLNKNYDELVAALLRTAPSALVGQANAVKAEIDAAFATALDAYASV